jgi:hypothetical protein
MGERNSRAWPNQPEAESTHVIDSIRRLTEKAALTGLAVESDGRMRSH